MSRTSQTLLILLILTVFGAPYFLGQEIVVTTGPDGKRVYSNTETTSAKDEPAVLRPSSADDQTLAGAVNPPPHLEKLINQISEKHGVDPDLVKAMAKVESNFNPFAVSYKGAQGLMQLLPETARRFGVKNVFDPKQNVEGGVKFLKFLLQMFPDNLSYVLAGYNAGENAVLRYGGIPPFRETYDYVRKIQRIYQPKYNNGRKGLIETAQNEPERGITRYSDASGRIIYTNVEAAY